MVENQADQRYLSIIGFLPKLENFSHFISSSVYFQSGQLVNVMSSETVTVVTNVKVKIDPIGKKATIADVIEKVNELVAKVNNIKVRDRGPKSERSMTDEDAFRVKFGDLKDLSHKEAAKELGLSYGQIYSARGDYTFNHVKEA